MKTIRYGIVGLGFVGPHHVEAVRRLGFVEIIATAGRDLEKTRTKAEQLYIHRIYGSYEELVNDPDVEVVAITTPTWLHHPIAMAAIANRKHVIVEQAIVHDRSTSARNA
ncbi:MAG TPA: Gfo/Idh/MocA family oxidoreductase [Terriglobales bacterium]|nr:Gfo/Idh/MocA family oxidoreductase [Terriglobales bacterium]